MCFLSKKTCLLVLLLTVGVAEIQADPGGGEIDDRGKNVESKNEEDMRIKINKELSRKLGVLLGRESTIRPGLPPTDEEFWNLPEVKEILEEKKALDGSK